GQWASTTIRPEPEIHVERAARSCGDNAAERRGVTIEDGADRDVEVPLVVDEHELQVRSETQLAAAELTQGEHRHGDNEAVRRPGQNRFERIAHNAVGATKKSFGDVG